MKLVYKLNEVLEFGKFKGHVIGDLINKEDNDDFIDWLEWARDNVKGFNVVDLDLNYIRLDSDYYCGDEGWTITQNDSINFVSGSYGYSDEGDYYGWEDSWSGDCE